MIGNRQFGVSLTCEQVMIMAAPEASHGIGVFGDYVVEVEHQILVEMRAKSSAN